MDKHTEASGTPVINELSSGGVQNTLAPLDGTNLSSIPELLQSPNQKLKLLFMYPPRINSQLGQYSRKDMSRNGNM